jgi:RNAse (barnase) inhibitor barstar
MAAFELSRVNEQQLDWTILRDGGIALYCRPEILAHDLNWLQTRGYVIHSFEAAKWKFEEGMHEALSTAFSFPDYYGKNLNALDECMWDDLVIPEIGGMVLVLNHYDQFVRAMRDGKHMDEKLGRCCAGYICSRNSLS